MACGSSPKGSSRWALCSAPSRSRSPSRGAGRRPRGRSRARRSCGSASGSSGSRAGSSAWRCSSSRASRSSPTRRGRLDHSRLRTAAISAVCFSRSRACSARGISTGIAQPSPSPSGSSPMSCSDGGSRGGSAVRSRRSTATCPLAFVVHLLLLRRHETAGSQYLYWAHAAGLWLLAALGSWEVGWGIDKLVAGRAVWPIIGWALVPGALLTGLALRGMRIAWPVAAHREAYLVVGATPLAVFLLIWTLLVNFVSSGGPSPLPYVPILNPLDLAEIGAVLAVALWFVEGRRLALHPVAAAPLAQAHGLLAALAFVWANAVLLRALHHWAGVPFALEAMLRSDVVQTAFSILWTLVALASMVVATRHGVRVVWLAGAALMAIVVVKLFMIDLSNVGTVQRIVSFISVGGLMLILSYFSPVPPRSREAAR